MLLYMFRFVASDSWGMKGSVIKGFEHLVNGAITVAPKVRFLKGKCPNWNSVEIIK